MTDAAISPLGMSAMIGIPGIDMHEVTRLTREGRLQDALDLLQGRGRKAGPAAKQAPSDGTERSSSDFIDLVPPAAPGGVWMAGDSLSSGETPTLSSSRPRGLGAVIRDRLKRLKSPGPTVQVPIPAGARFEQRAFESAQGGRMYKLYVPSSHRPSCPLVVMLHGCTQNPDDFAVGTGMNALAERDGFIVAYPAQTTAANPSKCWNWFRPDDQHRDAGEPAIIAGITREIAAEFESDPARIYVAGLSAGGAAALVMGVTYPDLYAAVGVHSGLAYQAATDVGSAFAAMRNGRGSTAADPHGTFIPTIVFHGDADRTVHPANADRIVTALEAKGDVVSRTTETISTGCKPCTRVSLFGRDGATMVEHWTVKSAGHAWSGGNPLGSFTDPQGPAASAEMVRFFSQHRLA